MADQTLDQLGGAIVKSVRPGGTTDTTQPPATSDAAIRLRLFELVTGVWAGTDIRLIAYVEDRHAWVRYDKA